MDYTITTAKSGTALLDEINQVEAAAGTAKLWWLGQMGFVIKLSQTILYVDAFLSGGPARSAPPPLLAGQINNADIVVGTHDHIDHIDRFSWKEIASASPQAVFVVPKLHITSLSSELGIPEERFVGLDDGMEATIKGVKIHGIAAAHELLCPDAETGLNPCLSYSISADGINIFHGGDFCLYEGLIAKIRECGRPNVMIVPINGRDAQKLKRNIIGNLTYQEAVDLVGAIKPGLAIPGHFDLFKSNSEDPKLFADYLECKYHDIPSWIGGYGEMITI